MKLSMFNKALSKALCTGAAAASIATLAFTLPATAQTDTVPGDTTTDTVVEEEDDGFDWGLLGLLGLLGLAGLARKPEERVQYRDPNVPASTTRSDYTNPR